ncbi:MAG: hypothetical protein ACTHMJ_15880 [Thermomicrobiales bacterium]
MGVREFGTPEGVQEHTRIFAEQLRAFAPTIVQAGFADAATVEAVAEELRAWGERPDATAAFMVFRSLGWVAPPGQP